MIGGRVADYLVEAELGSGGMGTVYRAVGPEGTVALKIVHPHMLGRGDAAERFAREVRIGCAIDHPNVVRTFNGGEWQGTCYLAMELVEGRTLRDLADELGRVPDELCRHVAHEAANGLAAIHATGAIHRDVKPENVLITDDHVVKLMDLGIARATDDAQRLSQTGMFVGSLPYASPEQLRHGGKELDGRADLWALGVLMYELLTGANPFRGDTPATTLAAVLNKEPRRAGVVNPQLSPFLEEIVHNLIRKARDERFGTAQELVRVLAQGEASNWWTERAAELRSAGRRGLRRVRVPRETAVHGRDDELARLDAAFEAVRAGRGTAVLVEGEAGIGKSRLVDEFVRRLEERGEDVGFAFGTHVRGGGAAAAFVEAIREEVGSAGCGDRLAATPLLAPAFDAWLRDEPPPPGALALTAESLHSCIAQVLRSLAAERPTVVLVEDLHLANAEARALFEAAFAATRGCPLFLVGTLRPGTVESWTGELAREERCELMTLGRLGPKDLVALLGDSLRSERLADHLAGRIAVKSDGNPFFVFEILRGLRDGQFITRGDDGTWVSTRVVDDIELPESVVELVGARVAGLDDEERNLLDVAACAGSPFDPSLVGEALGMKRIVALQRFARIEKRHRLVRSVGREFAFDQQQVREILYSGLNEQLQEVYHAELARALRERHAAAGRTLADLDGAQTVAVCGHLVRGACFAEADGVIDRAVAHLKDVHEWSEAEGLLRRLLAEPDAVAGARRVELSILRCQIVGRLARPDEHLSAAREALRLAEDLGDDRWLVGAALELAAAHANAVDVESSDQVATRALAAARRTSDAAGEARALARHGLNAQSTGRLTEGLDLMQRALEIARGAGLEDLECRALGYVGNTLMNLGRYEEAVAMHESQIAASRRLGERRIEAIAHGNIGNVRVTQGRVGEGRPYLERELEIMREIGDRRGETRAVGNLGNTYLGEGDNTRARELYELNLLLAREVRSPVAQAAAHANIGVVLRREGRLDDARLAHAQHVALSRSTQNRLGEAIGLGNLGNVLQDMGHNEDAVTVHMQSLELAREIGYARAEILALHNLGNAASDLGDPARALDLYRQCIAVAESVGFTAAATMSRRELGRAHAALGDTAAAREALNDVASVLQGAGDRKELLAVLTQVATLADATDAERVAATDLHDELSGEEVVPGHIVSHRMWLITGDLAHLDSAFRHLERELELVCAETRTAMLARVPSVRAVFEAARDNGLVEA